MVEQVLAGTAALVTGGGGGIGSASAAWLARDGAAVMIMGRSESTLLTARKRVLAFAGAAATVECFTGDALEVPALEKAFAEAEGLTGRLGIAVSVVGSGTLKPLLMFDDAEVLEEMRRNIVSAFLVIRHATPLMARAGGGSIICTSSGAARIPWPFLTMYNTSKSGVEGLVRGSAIELGPLRIRVNAVRPGLVRTETNETGLFANDDTIKQFIDEIPLGRTGVPDDIAAGVRYLAGPESSWVTGQSLGIGGGNELTKAPYLEALVRQRYGDDPIDAVLSGRIPTS
jgi:NAD(P)-dependent dehydrogenase (short-subunit alcohol dehydrogenase family)